MKVREKKENQIRVFSIYMNVTKLNKEEARQKSKTD